MRTVRRAALAALAERRHRPERRWAAEVAPLLVAGFGTGPVAAWRTESVAFTSTSVAVATVTRPDSARRFVVKMPWTADGVDGLRRQADVLATLRDDERLAALRPVLPSCLGQGDIAGRPYWVEEALPGVPASLVMGRGGRRDTVLAAAARVIGDLHAGTAEPMRVDDAAVDAWVGAPLRRLVAYADGRPGSRRLLDGVARLRAELPAALAGRTLRTCWIHGDFWPGNLLTAPARAGVPEARLTGVVDWDRAAARQLPLHDLLHLHVFARRLARGEELGEIVVRALRGGVGDALAVPPARLDSWLDGIPPRAAVLLYWLRHVALFLDSGGDHDKPRWRRGNVERVLAHV